MSHLTRRPFVALCLLAPQLLLSGCGGGDAEAADAPDATGGAAGGAAGGPLPDNGPEAAPLPAWDLQDNFTLVAGAATSFDLTSTLPAAVRLGGTFSVDPSGLPLPASVHLTPEGILSVANGALAGLTSGVVFAYAEP